MIPPVADAGEALALALDESLGPRGPAQLYQAVDQLGLPARPQVVDIGCGGGGDAIELARRLEATVLGVDPDRAAVADARDRLEAAARDDPALAGRIRFTQGRAEAVPVEDGAVDLVYCRDVLSAVADLGRAYGECARALRPGGRALVHQVFATDRLEPLEATELCLALGWVADSLRPGRTEQAVASAGLHIVECAVVGSEWAEHLEEQGGTAGRLLLHASRLRRAPERYAGRFGPPDMQAALGRSLRHIFLLVGKLSERVYVLSKPPPASGGSVS